MPIQTLKEILDLVSALHQRPKPKPVIQPKQPSVPNANYADDSPKPPKDQHHYRVSSRGV